MAVQEQASEPQQLPIVESCAKQVQRKRDKSKSEAIPICVKTLKKAGRIRQRDDGSWVQVKPDNER